LQLSFKLRSKIEEPEVNIFVLCQSFGCLKCSPKVGFAFDCLFFSHEDRYAEAISVNASQVQNEMISYVFKGRFFQKPFPVLPQKRNR
jgi:hypothetical protein